MCLSFHSLCAQRSNFDEKFVQRFARRRAVLKKAMRAATVISVLVKARKRKVEISDCLKRKNSENNYQRLSKGKNV